MNYDSKVFVSTENTANGEVSAQTTFYYKQEGQILTAEYSGGSIQAGRLIGLVQEDGTLHFRYSHINQRGELRGGECRSVPETLEDGRIRLHETWNWLDAEQTQGTSVVEEVVSFY
ncbi:n-acetylglutamate synthase [Alkalicoccus urumqiensis]|uniref:N-acetylglutamate synthase n=1 Tax=Alkalicoccus urumqiensis TaxID=1548213 RepID=A0A2P6MDX3_ALKUR|nr:n-acetylglutamate synthase [Alkalicoccus urumqiensis]PRO64483.1 n-acetylglutamate synthase [Alkalicoccus urumqiensis]